MTVISFNYIVFYVRHYSDWWYLRRRNAIKNERFVRIFHKNGTKILQNSRFIYTLDWRHTLSDNHHLIFLSDETQHHPNPKFCAGAVYVICVGFRPTGNWYRYRFKISCLIKDSILSLNKATQNYWIVRGGVWMVKGSKPFSDQSSWGDSSGNPNT